MEVLTTARSNVHAFNRDKDVGHDTFLVSFGEYHHRAQIVMSVKNHVGVQVGKHILQAKCSARPIHNVSPLLRRSNEIPELIHDWHAGSKRWYGKLPLPNGPCDATTSS